MIKKIIAEDYHGNFEMFKDWEGWIDDPIATVRCPCGREFNLWYLDDDKQKCPNCHRWYRVKYFVDMSETGK